MPRICILPHLTITALAMYLPVCALAQANKNSEGGGAKYEFGFGVMGSFYDTKSFSGPGGSAKAGFENALGASVWLGQNMYRRIGGEVRYDYAMNGMRLDGGNTKVTFGGQTHAFHYDMHYHFTDRGGKVRPYVLFGGGVKFYDGTGTETAFQPLQTVAVLTKTQEIVPMITYGGGVKLQLSSKMNLRFEVRNNMSPFPKKVIAPTRSTGGDGWTNNLLPTFGVSLVF
ncbi:MAG: hypothetical protein NTX13_12910 [Acidobacteria bacterium]|jgi:hypothetical protein|nr:hypothetical protein [Acidobacteriota bacterium]